MNASDTIELVRRIERLGIELRPDRANGRVLFRPARLMPDALALELASSKWAVIRYLESRTPIEQFLDGIPNEDDRDDFRIMYEERVAERVICQGNTEAEAATIAFDELGRVVDERIGRLQGGAA